MKKLINHGADALPMVLSILASLLIAACVYASIFVVSRRMDASILIESTEGLSEKISLVEVLSALGLFALVIMVVCIQIVNNNNFTKPLHILRLKTERYAQSAKDAMKEVDALHNELKKIGNAVDQMQKLSDGYAVSLKDMTAGVLKISSAARQLFVNSAAVDNAAAQLIKDIETHQGNTRQEMLKALKQAGRSNAEAPDQRQGDAQVLSEAYDKFINEADGFIDLLGRVREYISGKLGSCSAILKATASHANLISLNAAVASANAGLAGREFAFIAEDIRTHAEDLREAVKEISEAMEQTESQTALISELASLHNDARRKALVPKEAGISKKAMPPPTLEQITTLANRATQTREAIGAIQTRGTANSAQTQAASRVAQTQVSGNATQTQAPGNAAQTQVVGYGAASADSIPATKTPATGNAPEFGLFDWQTWENENKDIRSKLDTMRITLRSVGAALAETSDSATSEIKRIEQMTGRNNKSINSIKSLLTLIENTDKRIESITDNLRVIEKNKVQGNSSPAL